MSSLRAAFPVLDHVAYLNAGSVGPMPAAAADAAERELRRDVAEGRGGKAQFERMIGAAYTLRERIARIVGASAGEIALTGATTDGVNTVLGGLELASGDEILTSDEEHPGLLAPLALARRRHGIEVRTAPFEALAEAVGSDTKLIACSHVAWHTGRIVDSDALRATGVPVLLDGAQSLGAIPVDVRELGCDYYAASGQKWLCGPVGTGYLYVRAARIDGLLPPAPGYLSLTDPLAPLELPLRADATRFDGGMLSASASAAALAALDVLEAGEGMVAGQQCAAELAAGLAAGLAGAGLTVAPRDRSTLVSWKVADPEAEAVRLSEAGFVLRNLPGTSYVRASVGAWSSAEELERLVATCAS